MSVMDGLISLHYSFFFFFLIQQRHNVTLTVAVFLKCGTTVHSQKTNNVYKSGRIQTAVQSMQGAEV